MKFLETFARQDDYKLWMQTPTSSSAKKKKSGSISKRGMNFVVIGKCGSFYIYHEKAGKKIEIKCPAENNF